MPGDPARTFGPVRPACPPAGLGALERRRWNLLGRLVDTVDGVAWPIFGTCAPWLPAPIRGLVRPDDTYREADPIG